MSNVLFVQKNFASSVRRLPSHPYRPLTYENSLKHYAFYSCKSESCLRIGWIDGRFIYLWIVQGFFLFVFYQTKAGTKSVPELFICVIWLWR